MGYCEFVSLHEIRSEIILAKSFTPSDDKDVTRMDLCADNLIP